MLGDLIVTDKSIDAILRLVGAWVCRFLLTPFREIREEDYGVIA